MNVQKECDRLIENGITTPRDFATAIELGQVLVDRLKELEMSDLSHLFKDDKQEIIVEGKTIRFSTQDEFYSFLAGVMNR